MKKGMDENKKNRLLEFLKKAVEDKEALNKCIREGGDISKVADERGIKLVCPI